MDDFRCGRCRALMFRAAAGAIAASLEIKCRRCGALNHLRPIEPAREREERHDDDRA
ncbi:Com family DNA-binding transcriptional regulator [Segnochrobactrum spirostomi]|uniref:Com family DNA-binding transcriptional regulator n=1 Tax=Segnochrobactrum spirostomi TaxID=2608987 RepID=A0A6A7Y810_9HYPH|nr:Com family DNA-binding transcriptional regulator [Segnochrobactrum spirostomi]